MLEKKGVVATAVAVIAAASFAATASSKTHASAAKTHGTLTIPFIGADSGPLQLLGTSQEHGAQLAINQINAKGGLLGMKLKASFHDDAGNPSQDVSVAHSILGSKPPVLFGASSSSSSEAIEPLTTAAHVIQFPGSADSASVNAKKYPYVFRAYLTEITGDISLIKYLKAHHLNKVEILVSNTAYGLSAKADLSKRLAANGMSVAGAQTFTDGQADFTPQALQTKTDGADVAYMVGSATSDFSDYAKAAQSIGLTIPFIGNAAVVTPTYAQLAGSAGTSTLGQVYANQTYTSKGPVSKRLLVFKGGINQLGGKDDLLVVDMYWYDMVRLWAYAVKQAGTTKSAAVAKALESVKNYVGVQGTFSFSKAQHDGLLANSLVTAVVGTGPNGQGLWKQAG
jgi:branched-chain amino acid transport system substrate-binding protein